MNRARQESLYRLIVETSREGIWTIDTEGITSFANERMAGMLGTTVEAMLGKPSFQFVFDEDVAEAQRLFDLKKRGDSRTFEFRLRRTDGSDFWAQISGTPLYSEQGDMLGLLGLFTDITGRRAYEQEREMLLAELKAGHARANQILESINDAFYAVDAEFRFTYINRRTEQLWQKRREDLLGHNIWSIFPHAAGTHTHQAHLQAMTTRQMVRYETLSPILHRWIDVSLYPEESGGLSCYFRDIHTRKLAEEEARHAAELLARSNADLQQFAYGASHDLREPLRTITSFAQILDRRHGQALDSQGHQYLRLIISGAQRMGELIDALLNYSSVVNLEEIVHEPVPLTEVVNAALMNLQTTIEETNAAISCSELPTVPGDQVQLSQLFQNLLANALKYRAPDRPPEIHISARQVDGVWRIAVRDNGIGIDPWHFEGIFGVFKRLHGRDVPGAGLGLAICQRIVQNHGGSIWVESGGGDGSTFTFTLQQATRNPAEQRPRTPHEFSPESPG